MIAILRRWAPALCGLLLLASPAARADDDFQAGTSAHLAGKHQEAISLLGAYTHDHPEDVSGWYNLGSAYAAEGSLGQAALAFERALLRDPAAEDAIENLLAVRRAARERQEGTVSASLGREPHAPARPVALWALGIYAVAVLLVGGALRARGRTSAVLGTAGVAALLGAAGAGWVAYQRAAALPTGERAVVIAPAAPVRRGPLENTELIYSLPEAEAVELLETRDGFARVRPQGLAEGWLSLQQVERILP